MNVLILGASGMLGGMLLDVLSQSDLGAVGATVRGLDLRQALVLQRPDNPVFLLDAETATVDSLVSLLDGVGWVVNAIGVIKPYIKDDQSALVQRALRVNGLFPHLLAEAAKASGTRVIQIATDCVYSGSKGTYLEPDPHDALDVYGKSKSLGEVDSPHVFHLRASIIGPEAKAHLSLLDWFLGQPRDSELKGFTNHQWNGVTTYHFGRVCEGIIRKDGSLQGLQHLIPGDRVAKSELLCLFQRAYDRTDLRIQPVEATQIVDRTLGTLHQELNMELWRSAGYRAPPTIHQMVEEMAVFQLQTRAARA